MSEQLIRDKGEMVGVSSIYEHKKSDIDFESPNVQGDMGLGQHVLSSLTADTVAVVYDDIDAQGNAKKGQFILSTNATAKAWRRGRAVLVGPGVREIKVGDLVIFPNAKGLDPGSFNYYDKDGKIHRNARGIFLSENRIFGTVEPLAE